MIDKNKLLTLKKALEQNDDVANLAWNEQSFTESRLNCLKLYSSNLGYVLNALIEELETEII